MSLPELLVEEPEDGPAQATLIWLHGLGATADDFATLGRQLRCPGLRVLALQAPSRPVTLFEHQVAPAWFDILPQPGERVISDLDGMEQSAARIRKEIENQQQSGIAQVAIGGFSQGGAMALYTALTHPQPLAASVCLSGYIPQDAHLESQAAQLTWTTPFFVAHGAADEVIPIKYGEITRDWLSRHGATVHWSHGAYAHEVTTPEITELGDFLRPRLTPAR